MFKRRGQFPLILFAIAVPAIFFTDNEGLLSSKTVYWSLLLGSVLLTFIGQLIRAIAIAKSAKQTSGRNTWGHEAKALNVTGIYSIVRHPLYLGNFFIWIGIVCFVGNPWFFIIVCLLFWLYYERIMFSEEVFLEKEFGEEYVEWSLRTPAFMPSWKHYRKSEVSFSIKTLLRREYPGISAAIIGFLFVDFVRNWVHFGEPKWLWSHAVTLVIALMISLVLRTLKHHTEVLREDDRS
ncbi:MAG: isoprenylcysteine carboxylmethyltransferase family protein [Crocinitomicaceae bacterium]